MRLLKVALLFCGATLWAQQAVETVQVVSKSVERELRLPGEFQPYLSVDLHARVPGYVEKVLVDRGSVVKQGELLVRLSAPEMASQIAEAEAKVQVVESQRAEASAKLVAARSSYERLKEASATPGVVAGNDLIQTQKAVEAAKAVEEALESSVKAARASVAALKDLEVYLNVTAPFDGVITTRYVHPGALVGPAAGASKPLVRLEQHSRLRGVVAVPEAEVGGVVRGARAPFRVPAWPGETFYGVVARVSGSVDPQTRTMPVELEVPNPGARLTPGMYGEVTWPVKKKRASLLVPASSIVTTTERSFVIRLNEGRAQWVNVSRGAMSGGLVEVWGALSPGDTIVRRGTDELRESTPLRAK